MSAHARHLADRRFFLCTYAYSHLSMEEYHTFADETMDELVEALEELLDAESDAGYEVDYHVRMHLLLALV